MPIGAVFCTQRSQQLSRLGRAHLVQNFDGEIFVQRLEHPRNRRSPVAFNHFDQLSDFVFFLGIGDVQLAIDLGTQLFQLFQAGHDAFFGIVQLGFSQIQQLLALIERDDFAEVPPPKYFRLKPGGEVRLKYAYIIKCDEVVKDASGQVTELRCTADLTTRAGGWLHLQNAFDTDRFERAVTKTGAASFSVGMPNFVALYALNASLRYLEQVGIATIARHA